MGNGINLFGPKKKFQSLVKEVIALDKVETEVNDAPVSQEDKPVEEKKNLSLADIVAKATGIDWAARKAARNAQLLAQEEESSSFKTYDDLPWHMKKDEEEKVEDEKHLSSKSDSESDSSGDESEESDDSDDDEKEKTDVSKEDAAKEPPTETKNTDKTSKLKALAQLESSSKLAKKTSGTNDVLKAAFEARKKKKERDAALNISQLLQEDFLGEERKIKSADEVKSFEITSEESR